MKPMLPIENCYSVPQTRLLAGEYPGFPPGTSESQFEKKLSRFLDSGITAFIDLTDPRDGLQPYDAKLISVAQLKGIEIHHHRLPIRDMDVCDKEHMQCVLDAIDGHLNKGLTVYVHCWGGVGRTGTVIGCWLVRHGKSGRDALNCVTRLFGTMSEAKRRRHPEGSPQTSAQRAMVLRWTELAPPAVLTTAASQMEEPPVGSTTQKEQRSLSKRIRLSKVARDFHSRLRGALLGGALGDALGAPVEFMSLSEIRKKYGKNGIMDLTGAGYITDDTQMTLFTAEGILRSTTRSMEYGQEHEPQAEHWPGVHYESAAMWYAYRRWFHTQGHKRDRASLTEGLNTPGAPGWLIQVKELHHRRAPGNTCLSALQSSDEPTSNRPVNNSKGCGGVMRVAPIGLAPCEDPFGYAARAAALTHGHPSGYLSAGGYANIVADLYFEQIPLNTAISRALARLAKEPGHEETTNALAQAQEFASRQRGATAEHVERLGGGWTGEEALAIGVYCALVAESFEHGVRLAVNHSGDSDSTGSITGALLGVQCGEHGLPADWLYRLELRDIITTVADDLLTGYGGGSVWRARYPGC